MPRLRPKDDAVGTHKETEKPVFQCGDTGLLYFFADPPKRYVHVSDVFLGETPTKERSCCGSKRSTTS